MLAAVGRARGAEDLRRQLPAGGGAVDDLVAVLLDGPGLVDADVAAGGGEHRLVGTQEGGDGGLVHLGAAHQEVYGGSRRGAEVPDGLRRRLAVGVQSVARRQVHVGPGQSLQHRRVGPIAVVVAEVEHENAPPRL